MRLKYLYLFIIALIISVFSFLYNKSMGFPISNERSYYYEEGYIYDFIRGKIEFDLAISPHLQKTENIITYIKAFKNLDDCIIDNEKLDYLEKNFFNFDLQYEKEMKKLKELKYSRPLAYFSFKRSFESRKNFEKLFNKHLRDLLYFKVFIVNGKYEIFQEKIKN